MYGYITDDNFQVFKTLASNELGARLYSFKEDNTDRQIHSFNIINESNRVYITSSHYRTYKLRYCNDYDESTKSMYISEHRNNLIVILLVFGVTLILILILILYTNYIRLKRKKRPLLQRIILKCNPKKFVKNYNEKKVNSANDIYYKALSIENDNESGIIELAKRAESELGVVLISKHEIQDLLGLCNPKLFMKPYNAEKVTKANALYARLKKGTISCGDYFNIKNQIEELYENM